MFSINFEHVLQWISFLLIICQVSAFCCCLFWLFLPEVLIELSILLCSHQIKLQSKRTLNNYNKNNKRTQQNTKNLSASKRKKQQKANKEKNNKNKKEITRKSKAKCALAANATKCNTVDAWQHCRHSTTLDDSAAIIIKSKRRSENPNQINQN